LHYRTIGVTRRGQFCFSSSQNDVKTALWFHWTDRSTKLRLRRSSSDSRAMHRLGSLLIWTSFLFCDARLIQTAFAAKLTWPRRHDRRFQCPFMHRCVSILPSASRPPELLPQCMRDPADYSSGIPCVGLTYVPARVSRCEAAFAVGSPAFRAVCTVKT